MNKVANNAVKFAKSNSFLYAEYIDNNDDNYGTIVIEMKDEKKLKIFRVSTMDWLKLYCDTSDEEVQKLMQHHGFSFLK